MRNRESVASRGRQSALLACLVVALALISAPAVAAGPSTGTAGIASASSPVSPVYCVGCTPLAPQPLAAAGISDVTLSTPNATTYAGSPVTFTATLPGSQVGAGFTWYWGDGNVSTTSTGYATYTYPTPGDYLVFVEVTNSTGAELTDAATLFQETVLPSEVGDELGNYAQLAGSIVANSTANANATGVISPGGFVTVENWITGAPSNPQWTLESPAYRLSPNAGPYATLSSSLVNATGINGVTVSFASNTPNGSYALQFSLPLVSQAGSSSLTVWSNFTFTVFVEPTASVLATTTPASGTPGTIVEYTSLEFSSWDPQLSYWGPDIALMQNVYQTLVFRNVSQDGSSPSDYVPDLATCVPGSSLCTTLYGTSLISGTGNYTFVLNPNSTFYDPSTGDHWTVSPNDVAFSLAQDCLSANVGYPSDDFAGWDLCQTLLPSSTSAQYASNASWDGGLHYPYNNTPANILSAILVNDSVYCPAGSPMRDGIHGNGCVTFVTSSSGFQWPQFLDFLSMVDGTGISSCRFDTGAGVGLPGWDSGSTCLGAPPGSTGNPNPIPGDTAWDPAIENISGYEAGTWTSPIRFDPVGSGPYYLASLAPSQPGPYNITYFSLKANLYWGGTPCTGGRLAGCLPVGDLGGATPQYFSTVEVYNNLSSTAPGAQAMAEGRADLADVSTSQAIADVGSDRARIVSAPNPTIFVLGMNLNYSPAQAYAQFGITTTLPPALLQDLNLRQFLMNAYPWQTVERDVCLTDGLLSCIQFSGMIPAYLSGYVPTNLTWPTPNPSSDASTVGSAGWWWAQADADSAVSSNCTAAAPCTFLVPEVSYSSIWNVTMELWIQSVISVSGGAIQPIGVVSPSGFFESDAPAGTSPFAVMSDGWEPDIFDPSNYFGPFLAANGTYGSPNSFSTLLQPSYEGSCTGPYGNPTVTSSCQGSAYQELTTLLDEGATCAAPACSTSQRELLYNEADHITVSLGLTLPVFQETQLYVIAPWIDPTSIATDPMTSQGTVFGTPLFDLRYVSAVPPEYPLEVGGISGFSQVPAGPSSPATPAIGLEAAPTIETGETILALVSVAGGTGLYHYDWEGLPPGCSSADAGAITCTPNATGSYTLQVEVTDSAGHEGLSAPLTISVVLGPTIETFALRPSSITLGQTTSISVNATGGIGALTFVYSGLPLGCAGATTSTFTCTPQSVGSFGVVVEIRDSVGVTATASGTLNVSLAPSPSPGASSNAFDFVDFGLGALAGGLIAAVVLLSLRRKGPPSGPVQPPESPG